MKYTYDQLEEVKNLREKVCTGCGDKKNLNCFGRRPQSKDGRETRCLDCHKIRQAAYRAERKPFELHVGGQVFKSNDPEQLKKIAACIPEKCELYEVFQSIMSQIPVEEKKKIIHHPKAVLSFREVEKACDMLNRGKTRRIIADYLHCSTDKLRISVNHYVATSSRDEYEKTEPKEK
jgi:hypothetical protein